MKRKFINYKYLYIKHIKNGGCMDYKTFLKYKRNFSKSITISYGFNTCKK